jgi:hypothetical protein
MGQFWRAHVGYFSIVPKPIEFFGFFGAYKKQEMFHAGDLARGDYVIG